MSDNVRKPAAFRIEPDGDTAARRTGARKPQAVPLSEIEFEPDETLEALVAATPDAAPVARVMRWGSLLFAAVTGLIGLWAGLAATQLIEDLFARSVVLGWMGTGLMALAGLAALAVVVREIVGLVRLARLGTVREDAAQALVKNDAEAAQATITALKRIYAGRRDTAWGFERLAEHEADIIDPADRIRLAETDLMAPLDETAGRLIANRARRVMLLTAVAPTAALDIVFVAAQTFRMLREVAALYGGRPGFVGTVRLARLVVAHLAAAGALAMSDQLVQQLIGHGILGRLSARFGEGAVNGILTARIGLAAIDVCRPLPFTALSRPGLPQFLTEVVGMSEARPAGGRRPVSKGEAGAGS